MSGLNPRVVCWYVVVGVSHLICCGINNRHLQNQKKKIYDLCVDEQKRLKENINTSCSCKIVFDKKHLNCKIGFLSSDRKERSDACFSQRFPDPSAGFVVFDLIRFCASFVLPGCHWECLQGQI